jgi:lipopolysaccharide/colanic/teichoic acid biosynthesis glycosyltransferase
MKGHQNKSSIYRKYIKRLMDFILALIAIIVLSPVFIIISLLVKINLGSPIIFKQKRPGLNEKLFIIYKFRTMTDEKNNYGELLPDSTRLTKFGILLRSTSLDELPELFNILRGNMSLVGPRPLLEEYLPYYTESEKSRHSVRPGLSGLAQINGRNNIDWNIRLNLDMEYVKNISFILDMKIILKTIKKVIKREDVMTENKEIFTDLQTERSISDDDKNN